LNPSLGDVVTVPGEQMVMVLALILAGLQLFGDVRHRTAGRSRWYGRPIADPQDHLRLLHLGPRIMDQPCIGGFQRLGQVGTHRENGYTVLFQGWPVGKIDPILSDKIDVDDLLWRTRQAIEDCPAKPARRRGLTDQHQPG
jgi:hypothetical protein